MGSPRMTLQTQLVLRTLIQDPTRDCYGLEVAAEVGLPAGTVYPILARLEEAGWVSSIWEEPGVHVTEGRPRRRFYRIDPAGAQAAREALARAYRPAKGVARARLQPEPRLQS